MLAIGLFHGAPRHFFYVRLEKSMIHHAMILIGVEIKLTLQASLEHLWSAQQRKSSLIRFGLYDGGGCYVDHDDDDGKYSDDGDVCDDYYP